MDQIRERELIELVKACTQPVLGICLGMQLLGRRSEESNGVDLLGIIEEDVPKMTDHGLPRRIWAGTGSTRKPGTVCSAVLMTARIFISFTAMPCR